jgi:hypothetical protein
MEMCPFSIETGVCLVDFNGESFTTFREICVDFIWLLSK